MGEFSFYNFKNTPLENLALAIQNNDLDLIDKEINKNKHILVEENIKLIATGTTGSKVESVGIKVKKMLSGPLGGDAQIAARVAEGKTKMVLFFKDPNSAHPHEPDISMLIRICDVHNIPLATNEATAQLLLFGLDEIR